MVDSRNPPSSNRLATRLFVRFARRNARFPFLDRISNRNRWSNRRRNRMIESA